MSILKQRTVSVGSQSQRVGLKQLANDLSRGGKHKYEVVDLDTNERLEDAFTNKRDAMDAFDQTVKDIERGMQSAANDGVGNLGMGGDLLDDSGGDGLF